MSSKWLEKYREGSYRSARFFMDGHSMKFGRGKARSTCSVGHSPLSCLPSLSNPAFSNSSDVNIMVAIFDNEPNIKDG